MTTPRTIPEIRDWLNLGPEFSDPQVAQRYAEYLAGPSASAAPVTLAEAKAQCRVETDHEDALIQSHLDAAIGSIDGPEGWLGRSIRRQVLVQRFDGYERGALRLRYPPIIAVRAFEVRDASGAWIALPATDWELDGERLEPLPGRTWPSPGVRSRGVRVSYEAGYDVLHPSIRKAILMMVDDLHKHRGSTSSGPVHAVPMSTSVMTLLQPFKVYA